ncbi:ExbD/TolR family protein [Pseudobdellovibrio sp. HCB154]|uniref:ExbD/TolR family protein n=1 Tax=Pseudobdellovibrio sp. HCB154 TaxID=3386277 RepID=UPI0039174720
MGMSTGGNKSSKMAMSEINVTPFVDVMLVLLVIFMVTAPMMQQGIDVNLPKTSSAGVELNEDPFVLTIDVGGKIKIASTQVPMENLKAKLKAIFEHKKNKQIYIQADKKVDYGVVAEVMGEARAAGIYNLSLITIPKE